MKISELLTILEKYKSDNGDIPVGYSVAHDYWGSIDTPLESNDISLHKNTLLDGPKHELTGPAIMIELN